MPRIINDWEPETRDLIESLQRAGCEIVGGNNGEDAFDFESMEQIIADLTACDESHLFITIDGKPRTLFLVYGNCPGELVADYSVHHILDEVVDTHYDRWSARKQPTKEIN